MMQNVLTRQNYEKGFLIDQELMAGVTQHPENKGLFVAFVLRHTTGEYLGYQPFSDLEQALGAINTIPRTWEYEALNGCGGCSEGKCETGSCSKSCVPKQA